MHVNADPILVVGASAGGVEALCGFLRHLPGNFPGAVFIVLHTGAGTESQLPRILTRCGNLKATHVEDGTDIQPGGVYVARPNQHLLIHDGRVRNDHGPRENRYRPSINRLFESAARAYGPRVIGILLSGTLDDGTLGLHFIKRAGGRAMVQDPDEAMFPGMPTNALTNVDVDLSAGTEELARAVSEIARNEQEAAGVSHAGSESVKRAEMSQLDNNEALLREVAGYTCPDCGGVLREEQYGELRRYRCHVGHELSESALLSAQGQQVEEALWMALRILEERIQLVEKVTSQARERGNTHLVNRFLEQNREATKSDEVIRRVLVGDGQQAPITMLQADLSQSAEPETETTPRNESG